MEGLSQRFKKEPMKEGLNEGTVRDGEERIACELEVERNGKLGQQCVHFRRLSKNDLFGQLLTQFILITYPQMSHRQGKFTPCMYKSFNYKLLHVLEPSVFSVRIDFFSITVEIDVGNRHFTHFRFLMYKELPAVPFNKQIKLCKQTKRKLKPQPKNIKNFIF